MRIILIFLIAYDIVVKKNEEEKRRKKELIDSGNANCAIDYTQVPEIRFDGFKEGWEEHKLKEVSYSYSGGTPTVNIKKYYGGEIPFIRSGEINDDSTKLSITELGLENSSARLVDIGDILYALYGATSGEVSCAKFDGAINQAVLAIKPHNEYNSQFIIQWLRKNKQNIVDTYLQGGQGNLSGSTIRELLIDFAPFDEQQQIGSFFDNLEHLISSYQTKLEVLKTYKKALLDNIFPKDEEDIPKVRFKGFNGAWERYKLSDIVSMHARIGWQNLRASEFLDYGDYMLITGTDFNDGSVNYLTCHYVEKERYEQDKNIQVHNGSILITKDGTLGKVAYVQGLSMPATLNAGVFNVQIKDTSVIDEKYLYQYLKSPFLMDYIDGKATGGTIKHLNQSILADFTVAIPKKEEQILIGAYFHNIDNLITFYRQKLHMLQNIRNAMLQKMFV